MKILAVGLNYPSHVGESALVLGQELERGEPIIFHKGDSLLRPNASFYLPDWSEQIDYEAELAVQINRVGKYISPRFAHRYYQYISLGIDFTARDLQHRAIATGRPWSMAKAFDNSVALGHWVDKEELGFPAKAIDFRLEVDGVVRQLGSSSDVLRSIDEIIAYVSQWHTLKMGDVIMMGTPSGVGPCVAGMTLEGYLADRHVLTVPIK